MRAAEALRRAAGALPGDTARLDAELLLAHLLGIERSALLLGHVDADIDEAAFRRLVARRAAGEPIAYIVGHREFWSLDLRVTPDVLIPRPDSETLIEAAVELLAANASPRVLDLGTGSGALLLAALAQWSRGWGLGIDRSEAAARVARDNARRLGLGDRAAFVVGDWDAPLDGRFDLILCNPPYVEAGAALPDDVRREPASALFAGDDGLDDYRRVVPRIGRLLTPDGVACLEIGAAQSDLVGGMAEAAGLQVELRRDLAGRPRCLRLKVV